MGLRAIGCAHPDQSDPSAAAASDFAAGTVTRKPLWRLLVVAALWTGAGLSAPVVMADPATDVLATLDTLPVKGRAPKTGYERSRFGDSWTDDVTVADGRNGCDTRNDVLRRDLVDVVIKSDTNGCTVLSGVLNDPYTGTTVDFVRGPGSSAQVQIDHVVALSNAWQTGAQQWDDMTRRNFANDPRNLLAVSPKANFDKAFRDAASWLPPNAAFRCDFVARQVAVKTAYGLWLSAKEKQAMADVLARC